MGRKGPLGIEDEDQDGEVAGFQYTTPEVPSGLITPFALLVALLTSYRLTQAHEKWEIAKCSDPGIDLGLVHSPITITLIYSHILAASRSSGSVATIHELSRILISRLCAIFPASRENKARARFL